MNFTSAGRFPWRRLAAPAPGATLCANTVNIVKFTRSGHPKKAFCCSATFLLERR